MGALHDGHLSLVKQSIKTCQNTVVSIYINPTQFTSDEDLDIYPQTLDEDIEQLSNCKTDCIFLPNDSEMYPRGFTSQVQVTGLSHVLEGKSRPDFFQGVTSIVSKLFNIVEPTHAFFGETDAQQLRIIQQMVVDLNYPIKIISCPIIRENNGLAMSSRNQFLNADEKNKATIIFQALRAGENLLNSGENKALAIRDKITEIISSQTSLTIDYISVVDSQTLEEISTEIERDILVCMAVYMGKVRLIDNFSYSLPLIR